MGQRIGRRRPWRSGRAFGDGRPDASTASALELELALDLQTLASDPRTSDEDRALAFELGEALLFEARALEPYDVDASTNLGRFDYTRAIEGERARFASALERFDEARARARPRLRGATRRVGSRSATRASRSARSRARSKRTAPRSRSRSAATMAPEPSRMVT